MKFSEMPYSRPDMEALAAATTQTLEAMKAAPNAAGQIAAYDAYEKKMQTAGTMQQIAYIRHTINTKDEFYNAENDYMDEIGPKLQELSHRVNTALLESPYRAELERHYGALMFKNLEIAARSFSPAIVELMQEENKLVSEYQNLYASATVEFDGKTMPLPLLGPYKQDPDRAVRKAAYEADAKFFDSHREELDTLYDKLVKVRDAQAKKMGLPNYIPLGYDRMGRNCYTAKDVAAFRDQIAEDMVPIVAKVKEAQRRRIGVEKLAFYDEPISFADGNAVPEGTPDEILAAGKKMYQELSPETAEFIDFMFENELFDVLSRDGKAPGGYCTEIADYKSPFIFSNFNATAGDVDVLTHEAGHAFEAYRAFKQELPSLLHSPTIEACECHSMSMEFLTAPWHHLFFGKHPFGIIEGVKGVACNDRVGVLPCLAEVVTRECLEIEAPADKSRFTFTQPVYAVLWGVAVYDGDIVSFHVVEVVGGKCRDGGFADTPFLCCECNECFITHGSVGFNG